MRVLLLCAAGIVHAAPLQLTPPERAWLREHPTITVATYGDGWPPFERYDHGALSGLAPAYLNDVARQLGLRIEVRTYPSWAEAFDGGCRREVDVLMNVSLVPERTPCLVFTASYVETTPVAAGPANRSELLASDRLAAVRIAVDRGTSIERAARAQFPGAQVVAESDTRQALQAVQDGKADVFIGNPYVVRAMLETGAWPSLAVLGPIGLPSDTLHFAVPDDRKPLASMIDKALARITPQQRLAYERQWLGRTSTPLLRHGRVPLTNDEQDWLDRIRPPRLGYASTWDPISFPDEDGRISGIAGDYVHMMQDRLGLTLRDQTPASLEDLVGMMHAGEADLMPWPAGTPVDADWSLTQPFARVGNVIITRTGSRAVSGLGDLNGKRIALVGTGRAAKVGVEASGATLVRFGSHQEGLKALQNGDVDAFVGDVISSDRAIRSGDFPDLRIAAPAGFDDELTFAVRGEYRPLVPLINRMLAALSHEDRQRIRAGWLEVRVSSGVKWRTVAIGAFIAALLVTVLALAWLRTSKEIRRREKTDSLMRDLTRNLPGVIFTMTRDPSGTYAMPFIAGNTHSLFGLDHADIAAAPRETLASRIHPEDADLLLRAFEKSVEELAPVEMDFRTVPPAPERWIRVSAVARRLDDGLVHWSGYWVDVSAAHRQADALEVARKSAESAAAARANFLAAMSHEIRTPMAGITGIIEILSRSDATDDQRYLLGLVEEYAQALRRILDDVLDLSRIEAGGLDLEPVEVDMRVLVSNSIELVLDLCRRKGLRCLCYIDPLLAGSVLADPTRLRQILLNLLSNAIKFTGSGYVAVSVQVLAAPGSAQTVCVSVTDTGIGIAQAAQGKLFAPFTQAHASTSRTHGGSGLGLAICRRLARLMQGELELESTPGVGTRVSLTLTPPVVRESAHDPVLAERKVLVRCVDADIGAMLAAMLQAFGARLVPDEASAELLLADEPSAVATRARFVPLVAGGPDTPLRAIVLEPLLPTHVRRACALALEATSRPSLVAAPRAARAGYVLVAEDHSTNRLLMQRQLAELGYRCHVVSSGEQALAALAAAHFDLLITDLQMPGMSGFELASAIRAREAAQDRPRLPILALSAGVQVEDEARCRDAGMDGHLRKPIGLEEMRMQLERWLPVEPLEPANADQTLAMDTGLGGQLDDAPLASPPPVDPPLEPLDVEMLTRSFGSRETICLVAEDLLANLPGDMGDLRRADEQGDVERMGQALHRITGALGTFGYRQLAAELRIATRTAEGGTLVASEEIARLLRRVDGTLSELGRFVAKNKADVD